MSKLALIFPGQGSQTVGMGKNFFENADRAREVFHSVDSIMEKSLSQICFEGPDVELTQTIHTQPAILTVSIIAYELLKSKTDIDFSFVAGHSLGEYSALYAAGVLDLESVVKLVKKRSELMNNAPKGAMTAILGLSQDKVKEITDQASQNGVVTVANYNTMDQIVISGESAAVEYAGSLAKEAGAKRAIALPVSGAFHSPLMKEPAAEFEKEVNQYTFNKARIPVITNIDAEPTTEGFDHKLVKQIYSSVMWTQTLQKMKDAGVDTFIEVGPGKILAGMVKKFDRKLRVYNVFDMESLETTLNVLSEKVNV
jgi:[acyl-carrier-protein] S-malonyltransferase